MIPPSAVFYYCSDLFTLSAGLLLKQVRWLKTENWNVSIFFNFNEDKSTTLVGSVQQQRQD